MLYCLQDFFHLYFIFHITEMQLLKTYTEICPKSTNTVAFCFFKMSVPWKYKWLHEINSRSEIHSGKSLSRHAHIVMFSMQQLCGTHLRNGNPQCRAKGCMAGSDASSDETSLRPLESRSITENSFSSSNNISKGNFCAGFPLLRLVLFPPPPPPP